MPKPPPPLTSPPTQVYDDSTLDPSTIRAGNPLLLYCKELDAFLTAEVAQRNASFQTFQAALPPVDDLSSESDASSDSEDEVKHMLNTYEFGEVYTSARSVRLSVCSGTTGGRPFRRSLCLSTDDAVSTRSDSSDASVCSTDRSPPPPPAPAPRCVHTQNK